MQRKIRPDDPDLLYSALIKFVLPLKPVPCQAVDSIVFVRPEEIAYITAAPGSLDVVDITNAHWKRFDSVTATGVGEVSFKSLPADIRVSIADSSYAEFKKVMGISDKADAALDKKPRGSKKNVKK